MNSKRPVQSRVLWFNVLSVIAIVLTEILANTEMREFLGGYVAVFMIAGSLANAILRLDTSKAIRREPKELDPVEQAIQDQDLKDF